MHVEENHNRIFVEKQIRVPTFTMTYEHSHNFCEIFYLKSGSCVYTVGNRLHHLSAGDLFIVKAGDTHCTHYEGAIPCERIVVYLDPEALPQYLFEGASPKYGYTLLLRKSDFCKKSTAATGNSSRADVRGKHDSG